MSSLVALPSIANVPSAAISPALGLMVWMISISAIASFVEFYNVVSGDLGAAMGLASNWLLQLNDCFLPSTELIG